MFNEFENIILNTGNVLNVTKKAGQKTSEELFDSLKCTIMDLAPHSKNGHFYRNNDDLQAKMTEHKRDDIKIGVKVFLNTESVEYLQLAIDNLLATLDVDYLDNLILAYHPKLSSSTITSNGIIDHHNSVGGDPSSPITNGSNDVGGKEGVLEWGVGSTNALESLKKLWKTLEKYAEAKKICQLGIADLDTESIKNLYETSNVKPTIAQINLSACCVVPPSLQEFCNANFIQLLTHSDPEEIITSASLKELNLSAFKPSWTIRYQVHIKCRGVLATKGFIVGAKRDLKKN